MISDSASAPARTDFIAFDAVDLDVVDRDRSLAWWRDVVGLKVLADRASGVELGVEADPLVVLRATASLPVARGYSGLYHLALKLPDEAAFAQTLARLLKSGHPISTIDHVVARSIYLTDPDGIGLELAFETPERVRSIYWPETATEPQIIDAHGRSRNGLGRLDVQHVMSKLPDEELPESLPAGTNVGHVHLKVNDLRTAYDFYRDRLGFRPFNYVPVIGYGDLGAGGHLTHRIAVNTWQGVGTPPRPLQMAGMDHFTLRFDSPERLLAVLSSLEDVEHDGEDAVVRDPAGNHIRLRSNQ